MGNRPTTDNSFLPPLDKIETRECKRRKRKRERGFQIRYANQIAEPKTGGESESNADLKLGNECGELECKAKHTHSISIVIMVVI